MPVSLVDADSLLLVNVGSITTRAMLFDIVRDRYRLLASGSTRSTTDAPYFNALEGIHRALDQLQNITSRTLIGPDQVLIKPSTISGVGVDTCAATFSAGPPLKVAIVGLLEDVSLESARKLAASCYCSIVQTISLNDRQKQEARVDALLRSRPDLMIVAGGTNGGASHSLMRLLESVGVAAYLLPEQRRPLMLFAGNQELKEEVKTSLGGLLELHIVPNIRPSLEVEQLGAAQSELAFIYSKIRSRQIQGVDELNRWANGGLLPTAMGLGRVVRFLSKANSSEKGSLGVDVGASFCTVAAAFNGELNLGVFPQDPLGEGRGLNYLSPKIPDLKRWTVHDFSDDQIHEFLYTKTAFPASLPVTEEDLDLEHALARVMLRNAVKLTLERISEQSSFSGDVLLPGVEPIIATGSVITKAASLGQCILMLLDGIQPTGVTPILLDPYHLVAGLGAGAAVNSLLAIQILESNSLIHLGTVISPVGSARPGTPILRLKATYENGQETSLDVKQGSLEVLPLPRGKSMRLHLQPLHNYDVGMGASGRGGTLRQVVGGALGVVIDARGRPFNPPADLGRRQELYRKWLWIFGGR